MTSRKRVMYSDITSNETRYIVEHLKESAGWDPVLFHAPEGDKKYFKEKYPEAFFADLWKLRKGFFNYSEIGEMQPIDAEFIGKLSSFELNFLNWVEDADGWNFSFYQRRSFYYDLLRYWNTVLTKIKPDLFVINNWPHLPSDYSLYLVAKYVFKIPVLFLDVVPRTDLDYFNIGYALEDLSLPFMEIYESGEIKEISPEVKAYLEKMRSPAVERPKHITRYFNIYGKNDVFKRYVLYLKMFVGTLLGKNWQASPTAFKKNKKPWGSSESQMTIWEHFVFREKLRFRNRKIKKYYESMCVTPDFNKKYIYFAAPYQPEAFSNLITGLYEDVFLILDLLSSAIPSDWVIYYKEHPATFNENDKGALGRNIEFYDRLKKYKNVIPVKSSYSQFDMLDHSQGVATTGGTVGWEASVRGKPALLFGSMWYKGCKSVFSVNTRDDVEKAIKSIEEGYVPDPADVDLYAESMHRSSFKGLITPNYFRELIAKCDDPKNEMKKIADAYIEAYGRMYERRTQ